MTSKVSKFIDSLDQKTRNRLKKKLKQLRQNPFSAQGVKKMAGLGKTIYRLRVGKIRVIYILTGPNIEIVDIDYRGNIY